VLSTVSIFINIFGWLVFAFALLYATYEGIIEPNMKGHHFGGGDLIQIISGIASAFTGLIIVALSEAVGVLFAIEKNTRTPDYANYDNKKCPSCAEMIKIEALKCRYCGEAFEVADIEKLVKQREIGPSSDYRHIRGQTGEALCVGCGQMSPINGMYCYELTGNYYHKSCLPKSAFETISEENESIAPSVKKCRNCNMILEEDSLYCANCGNKV
jgi:hypothetical protein